MLVSCQNKSHFSWKSYGIAVKNLQQLQTQTLRMIILKPCYCDTMYLPEEKHVEEERKTRAMIHVSPPFPSKTHLKKTPLTYTETVLRILYTQKLETTSTLYTSPTRLLPPAICGQVSSVVTQKNLMQL